LLGVKTARLLVCLAAFGSFACSAAPDVGPTDGAQQTPEAVADSGADAIPSTDAAPDAGCARSPAHDQVCADDTQYPHGYSCPSGADAGAGDCAAAYGWPGVVCCAE